MHSIHPTSAELPTDRLLEVDKQINTPSNQLLGVRIYSHRRAVLDAGPMPLVVHFHGGAFVAGSLDTGSCIARLLAQAGAVVFSLDYPLAPAQPFPQAVEAGYAALVWAWKARHKLVGRSTSLFVAGEEAGGNLAAAVALMARDRQQPVLAGQIFAVSHVGPLHGHRVLATGRCRPGRLPLGRWLASVPISLGPGMPSLCRSGQRDALVWLATDLVADCAGRPAAR